MPLSPGTRIGPYEIVAPLGAGGMGEVYRAVDPRLKRTVAIKVLPEDVAGNPERLARFEREAQVLAALNHPHIAAIYGLEQASGARGLVLELVEGQTLQARLDAGPLPPAEAIALALQMAEGLEAAHERGVVHRDLKPANVMIATDGAIKILDFGLAKALEGDPGSISSDLSLSPTMTAAATRAGVILGTAGYMSPEQARGRSVDRRSDIWAFGVILFEMLSGTRLFHGETVSDSLAGVLRGEIDWASLPAATPAPVRRLLRRCLERDPRLRLRDIGEARIALSDVAAGRSVEEVAPPSAPARRGPGLAWIGLAALVTAVTGAAAAWFLKPAPVGPLRKFELRVDDIAPGASFAISPDGGSVAYISGRRLWIRRLDRFEAREVAGHGEILAPCWSPDSQWVAYVSEGMIRKVAVSGGESSVVGRLPENWSRGIGISWGPDDRIALAPGSGALYEIPARGGDARVLVPIDPAKPVEHYHEPSWLPDGSGLLFTIHRINRGTSAGVDTIALLEKGKVRVLLQRDGLEFWNPVYSRTGHILYRRHPDNAGVWALPFSLSRREPAGEPFLVVPLGIAPSTSRDGTLVTLFGGSGGLQQLVWVDRGGDIKGTIGQRQPDIQFVSLSPDGTRAAVSAYEGENWDIWIHDIARGTKTRLTFDKGPDFAPMWTPDGKRILWVRTGTLFSQAVDGSGEPSALGEADGPGSFSPDGKWLMIERRPPGTPGDLWLMPIDPPGEARPFLETKAGEWGPQISPDGRYVAYTSDESGTAEVYLKPFPKGEGRWQVSVNGGNQSVWSRRGDEIVYRKEDTLMRVPFSSKPTPVLGTPVELFQAIEKGLSLRPRAFDLDLTGNRLLTAQTLNPEAARRQLIVITNWFSEFASTR